MTHRPGRRTRTRRPPGTPRLWVVYPPLRHHSERVYRGEEGEAYFGGECPYGATKTVWTDAAIDSALLLGPSEQTLLVLEPPIVSPRAHDNGLLKQFKRVYTFGDSDLPNVTHYRMGLPPLWPSLGNVNLRPWRDRKDAIVCVTGNKYAERQDAVRDMATVAESLGLGFDVYGRPGFDGEPWYRGEVQGGAESKRLLLSQYRYCLALENTTHLPRYLTEKLLDGMVSGCFCFYVGAVMQEYPEIPWEWVMTGGSKKPQAADHENYLIALTESISDLRRVNLDPVWRQLLVEAQGSND